MKVGLIGLGNMGSGMAASLLKGGHEVTVYNRTASKAQALVKQGAHHAAQVGDACRGDAVITMLADDGAVEGFVFGDGGVISSLGQGAIHISSSTISVALSEKMAAAHAAKGQRFVSAPVFGRPEAAAAAKLFVAARRRDGCGGRLYAGVRGHRAEDLPLRRQSSRRESGEAQRQFSDFSRGRSPRRGHGADRQGRSGSASVC